MFFDRAASGSAGADRSNDFLASYLAAFEDRNESDIATKKGIDFSLITEKKDLLTQFWQYEGSTTSPPCAEVLRIFISKQV